MRRRLLLLFVLVPSFGWVFWASCQSDDYRDTLPFRVFDAAPASPADLSVQADLSRADQGAPDLQSTVDGGAGDAGGSDAGSSDGGGSDAGAGDAGAGDAGAGDAGTTDAGAVDGGRGD